MNTKRRYNRSFKERAVKLSCARSSITELASELGVLPDRTTTISTTHGFRNQTSVIDFVRWQSHWQVNEQHIDRSRELL